MKPERAQELLQLVRRDYGHIAHHFSDTRHHLWPELESFLSHVRHGDRILDIGCGNGRLYDLFGGRDVSYTGVDMVPELLCEARKLHPDATFVEDDMCSLSHIEDSFDHCYMIASLHHVPSRTLREHALDSAARVLRKGGHLYITVWNLHQPQFRSLRMRSLFRVAARLQDTDFGDMLIPWKDSNGNAVVQRYYHAFSVGELTSLVRNRGFTVKRTWFTVKGKVATRSTGHNICLIATK